LARLQFGPIRLGRLKPGGVRVLSRAEVGRLLDAVE
jgi:16S rRNA U516 pseudouridylate synthase RsuA-like enzyme